MSLPDTRSFDDLRPVESDTPSTIRLVRHLADSPSLVATSAVRRRARSATSLCNSKLSPVYIMLSLLVDRVSSKPYIAGFRERKIHILSACITNQRTCTVTFTEHSSLKCNYRAITLCHFCITTENKRVRTTINSFVRESKNHRHLNDYSYSSPAFCALAFFLQDITKHNYTAM